VEAALVASVPQVLLPKLEKPPRQRGARRELVLLTAPLTFALGTALGYGRGPRPW
jgi:hypothetical protein